MHNNETVYHRLYRTSNTIFPLTPPFLTLSKHVFSVMWFFCLSFVCQKKWQDSRTRGQYCVFSNPSSCQFGFLHSQTLPLLLCSDLVATFLVVMHSCTHHCCIFSGVHCFSWDIRHIIRLADGRVTTHNSHTPEKNDVFTWKRQRAYFST